MYEDEIITRSAPRWAWDVIDETLAMDAKAGNFDPELRRQIEEASAAMVASCENADRNAAGHLCGRCLRA